MALTIDVNCIAWHAIDNNDVLTSIGLASAELGLSTAEAAERLAQYGPNALTPPKKLGFLYKLWVQVCKLWVLLLAHIYQKLSCTHLHPPCKSVGSVYPYLFDCLPSSII